MNLTRSFKAFLASKEHAKRGLCMATVNKGTYKSMRQCKCKAKYFIDGRGYCKRHAPVEVVTSAANEITERGM